MSILKKISFFLIASLLLPACCWAMGEQVVKKNCLGTITAISAEQLTVRAYDLDDGQYIEKVYLLNKNPSLKNINSLQELQTGDNVNLEYYVKDQKNIVAAIFIEKLSEEEKTFQTGDLAKEKSELMEEYTPEELSSPENANKKQ
jgi:hypothetical protein